MPKYLIRRTVWQTAEVEADNEDEALEIAYNLSEDDFRTHDDEFEVELTEAEDEE